mmetsp:Transcript_4531/g.17140  ORF Transcript_4531/g.17140 Transcript_4531/m.17140 type:complete len:88 (+) Transcript_4531:1554-1817(+)
MVLLLRDESITGLRCCSPTFFSVLYIILCNGDCVSARTRLDGLWNDEQRACAGRERFWKGQHSPSSINPLSGVSDPLSQVQQPHPTL